MKRSAALIGIIAICITTISACSPPRYNHQHQTRAPRLSLPGFTPSQPRDDLTTGDDDFQGSDLGSRDRSTQQLDDETREIRIKNNKNGVYFVADTPLGVASNFLMATLKGDLVKACEQMTHTLVPYSNTEIRECASRTSDTGAISGEYLTVQVTSQASVIATVDIISESGPLITLATIRTEGRWYVDADSMHFHD